MRENEMPERKEKKEEKEEERRVRTLQRGLKEYTKCGPSVRHYSLKGKMKRNVREAMAQRV